MPKKVIKFTDEETQSLKELQQSYGNLQNNIGVLHIRRVQLQGEVDRIGEQISELEVGFTQLQEHERALLKTLEETYGQGTLDVTTNTFTPSQ